MDSNHQLTLFTDGELKGLTTLGDRRGNTMQMDSDYLQRWKTQIVQHQHQIRVSQPVEQATLFNLGSPRVNPEVIDPFALALHSFSFFRLPVDGPGNACIYFVLDTAAELVLYIGETCRSNKRWKGHHDCKRYVDNYQSLHYQHGLSTAVNIAFWWDAPVQTKPRQQLELSLILKWRSPFNRESWSLWGRPFG